MFDAVSGRDHMSRTLKQEQITHDHRNFPLFKGWQEQVNPEILLIVRFFLFITYVSSKYKFISSPFTKV